MLERKKSDSWSLNDDEYKMARKQVSVLDAMTEHLYAKAKVDLDENGKPKKKGVPVIRVPKGSKKAKKKVK